jgi:hypothetical protein
MSQVEVITVHDEQGVDDDEEMVRIPKCIETGELLEPCRQIELITSEPRGG